MLQAGVIRCYITDRGSLPPGVTLDQAIARADADWIQIREKDLSARDLLALTKSALASGRIVLVNTRLDVALAAGAHGVHLPENSIPPSRYRAIAPVNFRIGVSCHSIDDVKTAEQNGADYVFFGPVFTPISKTSALQPRSLDQLARAARSVRIPLLALGGITQQNAPACIDHGAAGFAAISMFQRC